MRTCRLCNGKKLLKIINFGKTPIAHHLLLQPEQDNYNHDFNLAFCLSCGLFQLTDPIPANTLYSNYHFMTSVKYQPHIDETIQILEMLPGFSYKSKIIEVGCNDGSFIEALRKKGYKNIWGVEPARDACDEAMKKGINVINGYFDTKEANEISGKHGQFDVFISRHVLEHIENLNEFIEAARNVLSPQSFLLIEVPNFMKNLDFCDYSLWEEHINYFTFDTLNILLRQAGFHIIKKREINFSGGALIVVGQYLKNAPFPKTSHNVESLKMKALEYKKTWPRFRKLFHHYLRAEKLKGKKIAIYGAGNRACSLINFCQIGKYISFVVDDNQQKQHKFMPGSGLPIIPSEALHEESVDLCLLAVNAEIEEKVIARHPDFSKNGGIFLSILPPSPRILPIWDSLKREPL